MIDFSKGFFIFDKSWIQENVFIRSLSHAEYRVMIYLLSSALKISKRDERYKRGEIIASLYQINKILFVNASQETIAERCNMDRATAYRALRKFRDFGAAIKVPNGKETGNNDYYIIGFERNKEGKQDYFLVDSLPIRAGKRLPDQFKDFIRDHHHDRILSENEHIWKHLFGLEKDERIRISAA
jgi:DNA-binding MarR family transcriptional regulator